MMITTIVMVLITSYLIYYLLVKLLLFKPKAAYRLNKYINPVKEDKDEVITKKRVKLKPRKLLSIVGEKVGKIILMKKYSKRLQENLIKAGIPLKSDELLSVQIFLALFIFIIVFNLTDSVLGSICFSLMFSVFPITLVNVRKRKRYKLFDEQLGDSITLISNSLKSGQSFLQAISSVAKEMPDPISKEFDKVLKEMRLGVETEKALENLLKRIESDDLELMVSAVMIQRQIGGNLSEILDNISNTIRERVKLKGEIQTLTAQGRLSGIIISVLPVGLGIILFLMNPDYIMELFRNPIGLVIIAIALINEIIGIIIINKIVKIEV